MSRVDKYRKKCVVMKRIQSNKAEFYKRINIGMIFINVVISTVITFVGFSGNETISNYLRITFNLICSPEDVLVFFNTMIILLFIITILHMVLGFDSKQKQAEVAVRDLAQLINEIDDIVVSTNAIREKDISTKYMMITRDLTNSDRQYRKAKKQSATEIKQNREFRYDGIAISSKNDQEHFLKCVFEQDDNLQQIFETLRSHEKNGKEYYLGGGVIRDRVWDCLMNHKIPTNNKDIDVIYFDPEHPEKEYDEKLEKELSDDMPNIKWSVKNQARMHACNGDEEYVSLSDAIEKWPEIATCVLVRKNGTNDYKFLAPFGYDDLLRMIVRPTPHFAKKIEKYRERVRAHDWQKKWKSLIIMDMDESKD